MGTTKKGKVCNDLYGPDFITKKISDYFLREIFTLQDTYLGNNRFETSEMDLGMTTH